MAGRQQPRPALLSLQALQVADFSSQKLINRLLDHGLQAHAASQRAAGAREAAQQSQQDTAAGGQDAVRELLQVFTRSALPSGTGRRQLCCGNWLADPYLAALPPACLGTSRSTA